MGAARKIDIHGAKGGEEKPKRPTEAPDSLRSVAIAKMLIAIGEGEFEGTPTAKDIYLDNTPLQDPQGNMNFPNVKWEWRTGAVDQTYIQGIPSIENETTIGTELRSGTPWVRAISNTQLSAVRVRFGWPALQSVDASNNINGYRIEYKIELATDGGAYQQVLSEAVDGKTTSLYERTRRIDLPKANTGWLMRITRLTVNKNSPAKFSDIMQIAGFTEVIDAKIRYPNTAILYIEFSAEQFRSIPAVTVGCKARKWSVPSNYDPASRTYSGVWDGTFKEAYTNNPTWATLGITTNDRFGLGRRIKPWMVDKWELYRISQYCDQLVPDGKGGMEPRFICNLNLQSKADAWSLLRDISAIYRGMTYWAQGQVFTLADMPRATDFDFAYTGANVITEGRQPFIYSSASERTRYTRALISYDNPLNNYDTDVTAVTDQKLQRRYGDNPLEISAVGCTRESEAQRRGKWALLTNSKDRAVTFKVGLDGRIPLPGYVIPIADELLAGRPVGGRISAVNGKVITLDRDTQAKPGDRLILNLPNGKCEGRTVQLVSGRKVTVTVAYSVTPEPELVWALDADDLAIPLYRVVSVARPEPGVFEISAVQYDPSKFAHIDTGARLEERPISVIPITVVPAPASVTLTSSYAVNQGIAISTMNISWPAVAGAVAYDVEWRKDSGNWIKVQRTGSTSVDVTGIYSGAYLARIRSVSAFEISSTWKSSNLTNLEGKVGLPPAVSFLTTKSELFGISIKWGFPAGAEDTQRTELWYGPANSLPASSKLADLAYPQTEYRMQQLLAGATLFFWARLVDRSGNIGPFFPVVNGVMGQSSSDAGPILEQIKGQIAETELGKTLKDRINLIDGIGPGSVNVRIEEVKQELEALITDITDALLYDPAKAYKVNEIVRLDQHLYQAKIAVPAGSSPPNATYWTDIGTIAQTVNALSTQVQQNSATITQHGNDITAQAQQLSAVRTTVNDPVTGVSATASGLSSLKTSVTTLDGKVTTTAQRVDGIYLQVNPPLQGDDSALMGSESSYVGVWSTQSALIEGDLVQGQRTEAVEVKTAANAAAVLSEQTARVTADSALGSRIDTVTAATATNASAVQSEITARTNADQALGQRIDTVQAQSQSNASAVQSEITARTTADQALGQRIDTVQSTVGGNTLAIQTNATAIQTVDGKVTGSWSVRMQYDTGTGLYKYAGIGLGLENGPGGLQSQFIIDADRFAIGQAGTVPFAVLGGQTFIKSAFIQDASITNAKIGSFIQSNNYDPGLIGWRLNFDGTFEINGIVAGQGRSVMTNRSLRFWDVNGVKRVQIGDLTE
ncbi:putative phage tail protein [Pseudomonas sp. W3I7]|uniref:TipJ family phage tail tip protein n=1 Tax=Pseudomonas sp. W3I7 TaxID=3042292 RepID=UPI00278F4F21|nr:phage tail protein [Pseudomonas sp. W3I7]MDQ0703727.1 putative phage tail protein [Pseudomonas sp. W3I7]